MLGKRFQRTTSMAQIGPAFSVTPTAAAPPPPASDYQRISQWEILKQAEEMMMKMVAAAAAASAAPAPPEAAASTRALSRSGDAAASSIRRPPAESVLRGTFLDNCFFCKRRLKQERDIFIYRGDSAFCTDECRQRQILKDERSMTASKKGSASASAASVAAA